jgi:hypothetical protein
MAVLRCALHLSTTELRLLNFCRHMGEPNERAACASRESSTYNGWMPSERLEKRRVQRPRAVLHRTWVGLKEDELLR